MDLTSIETAYQAARGAWTGCDWDVTFGPAALKLNGLTAAQAMRLARATAGDESHHWHEAAQWLETVEEAANQAEMLGRNALTAVREGDLSRALERVDDACTLESAFPRTPTWTLLRESISDAIAAESHSTLS